MMDLRHVSMQATINEENEVSVRFFIFEDGKRKPLDLKTVSKDDMKYIRARFSSLLHKTADQWNEMFE